jgi:hypothetical protein
MATKSSSKQASNRTWQSRAVIRTVDAGNSAYCAVCDELIKFRARIRDEQVICNVYKDEKWDRVEHYHPECYQEAELPYGEADDPYDREKEQSTPSEQSN